jgi:hypothetical protein
MFRNQMWKKSENRKEVTKVWPNRQVLILLKVHHIYTIVIK